MATHFHVPQTELKPYIDKQGVYYHVFLIPNASLHHLCISIVQASKILLMRLIQIFTSKITVREANIKQTLLPIKSQYEKQK